MLHDLLLLGIIHCLAAVVGTAALGRCANRDRVHGLVLGGEHRRRHHTFEVGRHVQPQAVQQGGGHVGDVPATELLALRNAGAVGQEDTVGVMGADRVIALHDHRLEVLHRDEAEIAQHQLQVRRLGHCRAGKHVLALVDLGDDALTGFRVDQVLEVGESGVHGRPAYSDGSMPVSPGSRATRIVMPLHDGVRQ